MTDKTIGYGYIAVIFLFALFMAWEVNASTATAYWTGKAKNVITVTGKSAISCEYSYGNQLFWRTFVQSYCPTKVEVE